MVTRKLVPVRMPFMIPRVVAALILAAVLSVVVLITAAFGMLPVLLLLLPIWLFIPLPAVYAAHVAYKKERYEIHGDHLVAHRGGLLSDGRTELDVRNITHVRLRLPWLRHRFFKIGDVRVESAGSAASEITFSSILEPIEVYEQIQGIMRDNGFALKRGVQLHQESPTVKGALTDIVRTGLGAIFTLSWVVMGSLGLAAGAAEAAGGLGGAAVAIIGGGFALGSVLLAIAGLTVRYLDLTRRTYTVYEDTVEYTEGFLTRDNAFIPFENIADAATNRTAIDQILGLYDVSVSCQGSASEIKFRRLSRGPALQESIRTLVAEAARIKREKPDEAPEAAEEKDGPGTPKPKRRIASSKALVDPDQVWTATLKMHMLRAQAPLLITLPAFPLWVLAAVSAAIRVSRTTYSIGPDSMGMDFSFIGARHMEFAYDKVTGVQITRTPFDRIFGTVTVQIWSIGSPQPLTLAHVREDTLDLPALLRQCGIPADAAAGELRQSFGLKVWLIQNALSASILLILALVLIVVSLLVFPPLLLLVPALALLPVPAAVVTMLRTKRQRVSFHPDHLETQTGIFFRNHAYVRYDNIKKVETVAIPFTDQGRFKVYVAGERIVQQKGQQGGQVKVPYSVQGAYIHGISTKVDAMDALLLGVIEPHQILGEHPQDDDVLSTSKPAVANSIVPLAIIGLFIWPLLALIPIVAWQIKVRRYDVETDRVVERGGILFKKVVSVLFNRIDSLQQHQGALGKAFGNGQVTILTAGSSSPDFSVRNVPDYSQVYDTIREHYGKG